MQTHPPIEWAWLDARESISLAELARASGIAEAEIQELVEYGALTPLPMEQQEYAFSASYVVPLRSACKLRTDFDLDLFTVALLLDYLNRIELLEGQLRAMQARLGG